MRRAGGAGLTRLARDTTTTAAKNHYLVTGGSDRVAIRHKGFRRPVCAGGHGVSGPRGSCHRAVTVSLCDEDHTCSRVTEWAIRVSADTPGGLSRAPTRPQREHQPEQKSERCAHGEEIEPEPRLRIGENRPAENAYDRQQSNGEQDDRGTQQPGPGPARGRVRGGVGHLETIKLMCSGYSHRGRLEAFASLIPVWGAFFRKWIGCGRLVRQRVVPGRPGIRTTNG